MINQTTWKREPAKFDMSGGFLGYPLTPMESTIKHGLVGRLVKYATRRMEDCGFPLSENIEVSSKIDSPYYNVTFIYPKGGKISVVGILIGRGGWPSVDHRFTIEDS